MIEIARAAGITLGVVSQHRFDRAAMADAGPEMLAETLLGGPEWQDAATVHHGCFNRAEVKRRRNAP